MGRRGRRGGGPVLAAVGTAHTESRAGRRGDPGRVGRVSCGRLGRVRRSDSSAGPVGAPCRGCAEPRIVGDMGNSPLSTILLIALMVVAFYFLLLRPQKKRQQAQQKTMNEIVPGTRVLLGSGIFGTIISAGEKQAVLEISPGVHVTVLKQAIARVIRPGDELSAPTEVDGRDRRRDRRPGRCRADCITMTPTGRARPSTAPPSTALSEYDRPVADNPTFGNEPKNKD